MVFRLWVSVTSMVVMVTSIEKNVLRDGLEESVL